MCARICECAFYYYIKEGGRLLCSCILLYSVVRCFCARECMSECCYCRFFHLQWTIINLCYDKWNGMIVSHILYTHVHRLVWPDFFSDRRHHSHSILRIFFFHFKFRLLWCFSLYLSYFFSMIFAGNRTVKAQNFYKTDDECVIGQIYACNGISMLKLGKSRQRKANIAKHHLIWNLFWFFFIMIIEARK